MKDAWSYKRIPLSRIATIDTFSLGLLKHHVSALLEFDVTESRKKLHDLRKNGTKVSFNGWLIKVISSVLQKHPDASAYLFSKKKLIIFSDINISIIVEKLIENEKVPIPVVLERTNSKSALEITEEIENAKTRVLTKNDLVINKKTTLAEKLYYHMPGFLRRFTWKVMLGNPKFVYKKMGNAVITAPGMMGKVNGWFIHKSIHPVSFGIGSIIRKPVVVDNEIKIREILNMTILVDHDVFDGAPMVRLLNDLTKRIEGGEFIYSTNS
jgi:pyruvate/2-oxoglutarate dehydrogenase complex dihydrolipoamide acyltransferase (E2) component